MARRNNRNALSAIEQWRLITQDTSQSSLSGDMTDRVSSIRLQWLTEIVGHLSLGRRIVVTKTEFDFFHNQLEADNYDYAQAVRADKWIRYGDWSRKGADPAFEYADFTPSEDDYNKTLNKINARAYVSSQQETYKKPSGPLLTEAELDEWAIKIITHYEPKWGFKLEGIKWIDRNRSRVANY